MTCPDLKATKQWVFSRAQSSRTFSQITQVNNYLHAKLHMITHDMLPIQVMFGTQFGQLDFNPRNWSEMQLQAEQNSIIYAEKHEF
jgi:hypothetical protein